MTLEQGPSGQPPDTYRTVIDILAPGTLIRRAKAQNYLLDPEVVRNAEFNSTRLQEAIYAITLPYYKLFAEEVPDEKLRPGFLRKPKPELRTKTWNERMRTYNSDMNYKYSLGYEVTEEGSHLSSLILELGSHHDSPRQWARKGFDVPQLDIRFKDKKIEKIILRWGTENPEALIDLTLGSPIETPLGEFLSSHFLLINNTQDMSRLTIGLGEDPNLHLTQWFGQYMHAPVRAMVNESEYSWDPEINEFRRLFKDTRSHFMSGVSLDESMPTSNFLALLRSTLDLIPAIERSEINMEELELYHRQLRG